MSKIKVLLALIGGGLSPLAFSAPELEITQPSSVRFYCYGVDGTYISGPHREDKEAIESCANRALAACSASFEVRLADAKLYTLRYTGCTSAPPEVVDSTNLSWYHEGKDLNGNAIQSPIMFNLYTDEGEFLLATDGFEATVNRQDCFYVTAEANDLESTPSNIACSE